MSKNTYAVTLCSLYVVLAFYLLVAAAARASRAEWGWMALDLIGAACSLWNSTRLEREPKK